MKKLELAVLVLNYSYEPISITTARDIFTKVANNKVDVEEVYDEQICPGVYVPCVVRMKYNVRIPIRLLVTTRDNIYARDKFTCQYCGKKFPVRLLTLDHIMPRSRGGSNRWDNLVAACNPCNNRKDNKTPAEAGMHLLHHPKPLTSHSGRHLLRLQGLQEDERWRKYIYA